MDTQHTLPPASLPGAVNADTIYREIWDQEFTLPNMVVQFVNARDAKIHAYYQAREAEFQAEIAQLNLRVAHLRRDLSRKDKTTPNA